MPGTQDQPSQKLTVYQPTNLLPGSSYRFGLNRGLAITRALCHNPASQGVKVGASLPLRNFQRMLGLMAIISSSPGPVTHATPAVLAETLCSSPRLVSRMPPYQGGPWLSHGSGLLAGPLPVLDRHRLGVGFQKEGGQIPSTWVAQHCRRQANIFYETAAYQLSKNDGSIPSPQNLGVAHKTPRWTQIEASVQTGEMPPLMGTAQPVFTESGICAG